MSAFLFDSSATVKRYAIESGSKWVFYILRWSAGNSIFVAGIYRRRGCGRIGAKAQSQALDLRPGRESYQSFSTSFFSPLSESHDHRQFGHGGDELRRQ